MGGRCTHIQNAKLLQVGIRVWGLGIGVQGSGVRGTHIPDAKLLHAARHPLRDVPNHLLICGVGPQVSGSGLGFRLGFRVHGERNVHASHDRGCRVYRK